MGTKNSIKKIRPIPIMMGIIILLFLAGIAYWSKSQKTYTSMPDTTEYNPVINPDSFVSTVDNKYFTLKPGTTFTYESKTDIGLERIEVVVTNETKKVLGVTTIVVWDRVWLNNELIEDTRDWYAQDKDGNVWYFGEDTVELIDGKIANRAGSWEAGVDGAKAGIIMKADPKVSETYQQEYYKGKAEDMAEVLTLDASVTVPFGTFSNCLQTLDYTSLDPGVKEHKYYCPDVGGVALEVDLEGNVREELLSVDDKVPDSSAVEEKREEIETGITEATARETALKKVPGIVTDVVLEKKFGKVTYVVEIKADNGPETDVIIDVNTGEVLAIET